MNADSEASETAPAEPLPGTEPITMDDAGRASDFASARRIRRSFRFLVATVAMLTVSLWVTELYLRYDLLESQYRMALLLPDDSARAVLRNVVKNDAERPEVKAGNGKPNPKYVAALAAIEESDWVLARYEEACTLDPDNTEVQILYGCHLFLAGRFADARERFREAGIRPPKNALPRYLEAAALAESLKENGDLSEVMALIARTVNSSSPLLFPQPCWHGSLPVNGFWHAKRQRELTDLCCAPLYRLTSLVTQRAEADIDRGDPHAWDSWLEKMERMGEQLIGAPNEDEKNLSVERVMLGVRVASDALLQRIRIPDATSVQSRVARLGNLGDASNKLAAFQNARDPEIEKARKVKKYPLTLCAKGLFFFFLCYMLIWAGHKFSGGGRHSWSIPHTRLCRAILIAGLASLLAMLIAASMLPMYDGKPVVPLGALQALWNGVCAALAVFGLFYPAFTLPPTGEMIVAADAHEETPATQLRKARKAKRRAYWSLMRRYFGILAGGFLCVACVWVLGFRMATALYPMPMHLELLVDGMRGPELALIHQIQTALDAVPQVLGMLWGHTP